MTNEFLTTQQAAELLSVSEVTIRKEARLGRLPARKVGRSWRISRSVLEDWFKSQNPDSEGLEPAVEG